MKALRTLRLLVHGARLVRNPALLEQLVAVADTLGSREAMAPIASRLMADPATAGAFRALRRLGEVDLKALAALPPGTLGRAFAEHLQSRGLKLDSRPALPSPDRVAFVRAHLREVHDVWHVLLGFGTDVPGELGVQAFSAAQIGGSLSLAVLTGGLLNAFLFARQEAPARLTGMATGYLMGQSARPLFGIHWPELWSRPLEELRAELGIRSHRGAASFSDCSARLT